METYIAEGMMIFKILAYAALMVSVFFVQRFINKSDKNYEDLKKDIGHILDRLKERETFCSLTQEEKNKMFMSIDKSLNIQASSLYEIEKSVNRHDFEIRKVDAEVKHQGDKIYNDTQVITSNCGDIALLKVTVGQNEKDIDSLDIWRQKHELESKGGQ